MISTLLYHSRPGVRLLANPSAQGLSAKTAFIMSQGLYEFRVMPFGPRQPFKGSCSNSWLVSGYRICISVLFTDYGRASDGSWPKIKACKMSVCADFLGHLITTKGLKTTARLVSAVFNFPQPNSAKQTRQFMLLLPSIHSQTPSSVGTPFPWTAERQIAFTTLKQKLCEAPVLAYLYFDKDFALETDASIDGIGAVLSQQQEDSCMHPIAFASRSLSLGDSGSSVGC